MRLVQVILGNRNVRFQDLAVGSMLPVGEAHVPQGGIGRVVDNFCRGLSGDGPVELVLDAGGELLGHWSILVVVDSKRIDVGDLLVEAPLAGSDLPNALQQLFEVITAKESVSLLEALVVHDKALDEELPQVLGGPNAKLGRLEAIDPVADRDDSIEVVVLYRALDGTGTFLSNYFQNGNSCRLNQLTAFKDVFQVLVDGGRFDAKEFGKRLLGQPDRFVLEEHIDFHRAVGSGVQQEFSLFGHLCAHVFFPVTRPMIR